MSAVCVAFVFLVSCGGSGTGSSGGDDAPLGRVSTYFVEMAQKKEKLDKELREERDVERYQKKLAEYNEYVAETSRKAVEEGKKLVGREILCTGDVYPDLKVTGARIADYQGGSGTGSFQVRITVTPKRDITVRESAGDCADGEYSLRNTRLYYALMKADDHLITLGEMNPFSSNYSNARLKAEYSPGQVVAAGAPADILYQHKPHIGTDVLRGVVKNIRLELIRLGCDVRFGHQLTGLTLRDGAVAGLTAEGPQGAYGLPCDALVLSPGHSARDTFQMLYEAGVPMEQKAFAIGVRIEHPQSAVSLAQFGPAWEKLPAADYKLACHLPNGRSAFTFCVCPGGQVVAAASEEGRLVTNGMSLRARDGENINGGLLVGVGPGDFGGSHPLAGMEYQMRLEEAAFAAGGGAFRAPAQLVGDFLDGLPSKGPAGVEPTYRPGVTWTDLRRCLPAPVADTLGQALPLLDGKLHGFAARDSVLTGTESRSSSPVRVLRGEDFQSALRGLYPCGEGAGYAGGITSAAVDGVKVAEAALAGTAV